MNLSNNPRRKSLVATLLLGFMSVMIAACGHGSLPNEQALAAGAAPAVAGVAPTPKVEDLTIPAQVETPKDKNGNPYNPVELWQKCKETPPLTADPEKQAQGVTPGNCIWAGSEVRKLATSGTAPPGTAAPPGTDPPATDPTTPPASDPPASEPEAPSTTVSMPASLATQTDPTTPATDPSAPPAPPPGKPAGMEDVVANALLFQMVAEQNGYSLGVGVTCQMNCVLLNGIQGKTDSEKAWSLMAKAVESPVYLDDAARTVKAKCGCYNDTRPIGDMAKAADDLRIVLEAIWYGKGISSGEIPAGTLVYNTVVNDGKVVQFVYTTTQDRAYVQFDLADGTYLRFFTTCGNRTEVAPPGTPETPNPPCHDDTPNPCAPPPCTENCQPPCTENCGPPCTANCGTTTTVCTQNCGGKQHGESITDNSSVPSTNQIGNTTVPPVPSIPVVPTTTGTGCDAAHPCPTNAPPTSNPNTTLPQSCAQNPGKPGCTPSPPPPTATSSTVTTTTHVSLPPPPGSGNH